MLQGRDHRRVVLPIPALLVTLVLNAFAAGSLAQPAKSFAYAFEWSLSGSEDPAIEKQYTAQRAACYARGTQTTPELEACAAAEFSRQDARLNKVWKSTLARMPASMHGALLRAQRKWIADRDPWCETEAGSGSGQGLFFEGCRVDETIRRIIWLETLRPRRQGQ